ncbi:MAG: undecaprenyldiphospho-muramoylpentapeptide beta-N-acetylglucosaminyltransferase [Sneathiellaceae bacterium]
MTGSDNSRRAVHRRIVLAAGGTGGHLFPAQSVAARLTARGASVRLMTDARGAGWGSRFAGAELDVIPSGTPAGGGGLHKARAAARIAQGVMVARRLLKAAKPDMVVGFGGYPSLPPMLAAAWLGLPTLIHEQNAVLGRANRVLAGRVGTIAASFPATERLRAADAGKLVQTGNPVREAIIALRGLPYVAPNGSGPVRLLVLGGSQGARVMSDIVPAALTRLTPALRNRLRVTQQCRQEDLARVTDSYAQAGIPAELAAFIEDVPQQLGAAHLVIARAGASTVCELIAAGRPAILVPYPFAADDHQAANARALVAAGGAWAMEEGRFTPQSLAEGLCALTSDPQSLADMAGAARMAGHPDAADVLADLILARADAAAAPAAVRTILQVAA